MLVTVLLWFLNNSKPKLRLIGERGILFGGEGRAAHRDKESDSHLGI